MGSCTCTDKSSSTVVHGRPRGASRKLQPISCSPCNCTFNDSTTSDCYFVRFASLSIAQMRIIRTIKNRETQAQNATPAL